MRFYKYVNIFREFANLLYSIFLVCTPVGFVRLFGVVGSFLVKPQFLKNLDEEFFAYKLEEDCIRRR